eukprot:4535012-Pyramimonas_sp.AAC.1
MMGFSRQVRVTKKVPVGRGAGYEEGARCARRGQRQQTHRGGGGDRGVRELRPPLRRQLAHGAHGALRRRDGGQQ